MRIKEVRVYSVPLAVMGGTYRMSMSSVDALDSTLIEIVTDDGASGWGETCPVGPTYQPHHALGARAALAEIAPGLIGFEIASPRAVYRRMDERLAGHGYAKAAVDMAVLDLLGKKVGLPVSTLIGGALTDRVPTYYSTVVGDPQETARIAGERMREGFPRLQLKVSADIERSVETVRRVWEVVGLRCRLAVDANRGLTVVDALTLSRLCAEVPFVFEQPCNTMEEVASLKGRIRHPVFLDENTEDGNAVLRAVSSGIADGFGLKVTRLGGLTKMAAVRDICAMRSMPHTCDDAWGGDVIAAACVHLAATVEPRFCEGAWIAQPYIEGHYDERNPVVIENGHITVPQGPGLGVTPDRDRLGIPVAVHGG